MEEGNNEQLQHYGVPGMKWGIRRASKALSKAKTQERYDKAVSSLNKHRSKASTALEKYKKNQPKLDENLRKSIRTDAVKAEQITAKANKISAKAAKKRNKMYGFFTSEEKAKELEFKANKLQAKADKLNAKASKYKANYEKNKRRVEENDAMIRAFEKGINDIDKALVEKGRKFVN